MSISREADGFGNKLGQGLESWGNSLINKSGEHISFRKVEGAAANLDMVIFAGIIGASALGVRDIQIMNSLDSYAAREVLRSVSDTEFKVAIAGLVSVSILGIWWKALEHRTYGSFNLNSSREDKLIPIPVSTTVIPLIGRGLFRMGQSLKH